MTTTPAVPTVTGLDHAFPDLQKPTPPPEDVPDGWAPAPPDFVGIGTMRGGTSWWWLMMVQHPRFATVNPRNKELHFFDHHLGVADIEPESYHRYFPRPEGMISGEWTPRYMYDFWTPPMLREVAPDAKLLVMLRDPIDRYLSGLSLTRDRGFPSSHAMLHHQFERSLYGQQFRTLLSYFPADQILVLQYEQCAAVPEPQVRRTFEFVGLDPDEWKPTRLPPSVRINESKGEKPGLAPATREALVAAFRPDLATLFDLFPALDPTLWPTATAAGL